MLRTRSSTWCAGELAARKAGLEPQSNRLLSRAWKLEAVCQPVRLLDVRKPCFVESLGKRASLLGRHVGAVVGGMATIWGVLEVAAAEELVCGLRQQGHDARRLADEAGRVPRRHVRPDLPLLPSTPW